MKKKIIICGGGTLGHILPIIPVIIDIYEKYDLYYIGTKKGLERNYFIDNNINKYFKKLYFLDMIGINRKNIFKNIKVIRKYYIIRKKVKNILNNIKPNLIIGMGGYISGVVINIAIKNKIKTIIHEQNYVMGLSNKLVYKKVNKTLLSYHNKKIKNDNIKVIGNPRYTYIKEKYKTTDKNIILIVGGSLGSKFINDLILNNINDLIIDNYIIKIIVGRKYYQENINKINNIIRNNNNNIEIYPFLNNLIDYMRESSVIVSRSGASTISEIIALAKPSILIPSPNVTQNHQYLNALDLYNKKCAMMIEEKDLNINKLKQMIIQLITNYAYKTKMINNLSNYYQNNPKIDFINIINEEIWKK